MFPFYPSSYRSANWSIWIPSLCGHSSWTWRISLSFLLGREMDSRMRKDLNIGPFGYSCIGFLTIAALIAIVRAILITWGESRTEDWIGVGIAVSVIFGVSILSYWTGRLVVYLLSFLD